VAAGRSCYASSTRWLGMRSELLARSPFPFATTSELEVGRSGQSLTMSLHACPSITNVTNLFRSESLRELVLCGLELASAPQFVDVPNCDDVADVAAVVNALLLSG
jgi:hypothetical protein